MSRNGEWPGPRQAIGTADWRRVRVYEAVVITRHGGHRTLERELSVLLATDRVIPVAHGATFDAFRDVSPVLASRS